MSIETTPVEAKCEPAGNTSESETSRNDPKVEERARRVIGQGRRREALKRRGADDKDS
jgi:hypothetical protein